MAAFTPPDYSQFAANTGYGYNNWQDQMNDAFSTPSRGAGVFMGNKAPRYGRPAPNMTFPTAFQGLLGQYIGQQQGGTMPNAPGGMPGGGMPGGGMSGPIRGGAMPGAPAGGAPGGAPMASPMAVGGGLLGGGVQETMHAPAITGSTPGNANNWGAPGGSMGDARMAMSSDPSLQGALTNSVGAAGAHTMNNAYQAGGANYRPWLNSLVTQGIDAPTAAMAPQWQSEGLGQMGPDGKWQWAAGKGWDSAMSSAY